MSEATKAVFLSYASQDAEAAKRIADALRTAGVEVWFDAEGGLEHGDEWDAKIRRQIKECVLFLAVISANTQAREEGYFRIEWDLAAERARGIASGVAFILPVVIDDTKEPAALVPDRFRSVQWTKLPGGNVPPEVLQRFLKLWSHRAGVLKHLSGESPVAGVADPGQTRRDESPGSATPATGKRSRWLAGAVAALVAIIAACLVFKPRRSPEEIAKIVADAQKLATAVTPPAPAIAPRQSEARQIAEKARAMFDSLDGTRDDYKLAEELIAQAKAKDATDAEVCAVEAQLHERFIQRGWDTSDARRESARAAVQRAIRLDPRSFEARWARASLLAYTGDEGEEKVRQLRELRRERPTDKRILRTLGSGLDRLGRTEEAIPILDESAALPGGDPLSLYTKSQMYWFAGRTAEAEAAIEASIAQQPFTSALLMNVWYKATLHGDLDRARALLNRINPAELVEDRACFFAFYVEWLARRPDAAIARLAVVPRDWLNDNFYRGPKAALVGDAQQLAGRPDAAALEWRAALKLVDQRLAASPNSGRLLNNRFGLLVRLGQREEAERLLGVLSQLLGADADATSFVLSQAYARLGRNAEAISQISAGLKRGKHVVPFTAADLRLNPEWDPLRGDPAFAAVIAEAEAIEKAAVLGATPPSDWPKDPDLKRAMKLLNSPEAIVSDVALAEDIVKTVLAVRPTDSEATLAMGRVQVYYLLRGFDRSEERFATAKHYAERAMALTPDDPEAMAVMAIYLYRRNVELSRAQKLIRQAIALRPTEPLYYRTLDNVLSATPSVSDAEIIASAKVTTERFPADALGQYDLGRHYRDAGMLAEAEHYFDVAIKLGPVANAIIARARLMLFAHGDPAGMKAVLDQLPERYRGTDRAVFSQFSYALVTGQPQLGLDALQAMPEAWMIDFDYTGPIALLQGELLLLQGKTELARLRFTEALAELGRHKIILERNFSTTWLETWLLMRLGRLDEARRRNEVFFPELARPFRIGLGTNWWFNPITQNLLLGERTKALDLMREAAGFQQGGTVIRNALHLDPRMAPFRADPEIVALLAEPEAKQ